MGSTFMSSLCQGPDLPFRVYYALRNCSVTFYQAVCFCKFVMVQYVNSLLVLAERKYSCLEIESMWEKFVYSKFTVPWYLWKQEHHSWLETSLSLSGSHDLRKALVHTSLFSELKLDISDWSSWRSKFVSSLENIQPRESLQRGTLLMSTSKQTDREVVERFFIVIFSLSLLLG